MGEPSIFVLTGPSAVGKTAVALAWAEARGAEIVSCDSLLVYRGMDVGTAKPSEEERGRVPHHLIDVVAPDVGYSVADYVDEARRVIAEICGRGCDVLVTGGSGFYLKAFYRPVTDDVVVSARVIAEVDELESALGAVGLRDRLLALNPGGVGALDLQNPRRVRKALERCLASGRTVEDLRAEYAARPGPFAEYSVKTVVLLRDPAELRDRVLSRARGMVADGLIAEVRRLRAAGFEKNPSAARAIGYRETLAWLDAGNGASGEDTTALVEDIAANTRRLIKKQLTWFRGQLPEDARRIVGGKDDFSPDALFL